MEEIARKVKPVKKNRVIEFEPRERLLEKAKKYVESLESFFEEADRAIPLLLKAMKYADRDLRREIMVVLGSFAKAEIAWPLVEMMTDPSENEEVRHDASVHLSVIGPFLKDPQPLRDRWLKEIESADAQRRLHAAFALGWEGVQHPFQPLAIVFQGRSSQGGVPQVPGARGSRAPL